MNIEQLIKERTRLIKGANQENDEWSDPQWQAYHFQLECVQALIDALETPIPF